MVIGQKATKLLEFRGESLERKLLKSGRRGLAENKGEKRSDIPRIRPNLDATQYDSTRYNLIQ